MPAVVPLLLEVKRGLVFEGNLWSIGIKDSFSGGLINGGRFYLKYFCGVSVENTAGGGKCRQSTI